MIINALLSRFTRERESFREKVLVSLIDQRPRELPTEASCPKTV